MNFDKTVEKFFSRDKDKIMSWSDVNKDKLGKIKLSENELKMSLSYFGNIYVIDSLGYFRGFVTFGGNGRNPEHPYYIVGNTGKIKCWYEKLDEFGNARVWKIRPDNNPNKFTEDERIHQDEAIRYLLSHTAQIIKPEYNFREKL